MHIFFLLQIVDFLNDLYVSFDEIISRFDVYKVSLLSVRRDRYLRLYVFRFQSFQLITQQTQSFNHPQLLICSKACSLFLS